MLAVATSNGTSCATYRNESNEPGMMRSTILALTFAAIGAAPLSASAGQPPSSAPEQTPLSSEQTPPSAESSDDQSSSAEPASSAGLVAASAIARLSCRVQRFLSGPEISQITDLASLSLGIVSAMALSGVPIAIVEMRSGFPGVGGIEKYEEILTKAQTNRDIAYRLKQPLRDALSRVWT